MPVFGSEEDAGAYLTALGAFGCGFVARPVAAQDLASLLSGPLSSVGTVALDPPPGMDVDAMLELISVDRKVFVQSLIEETSPQAHALTESAGWNAHASGPLMALTVLAMLGLLLASQGTALARDGQDHKRPPRRTQRRSCARPGQIH